MAVDDDCDYFAEYFFLLLRPILFVYLFTAFKEQEN
jgi:hypothetical protein